VAVFRLGDHIRRLFASAKILMIEVPYSVEQIVQATREVVRVNKMNDGCYLRPLIYLGYGEMAQPAALLDQRLHRRLALGHLPGRRGDKNGVTCKISSWRRHDPNAVPTRGQEHRDVRELLSGQVEALKRATTRPSCSPGRQRERVHGENIFIVRDGVIITPPTLMPAPWPASPRTHRDHRHRPRVRGAPRAIIRTRLTWRTRPSSPDAAEVVPIRPSTTVSSVPARPAGYRACRRPTSPPCAERSTSNKDWLDHVD